MVVVLALEYDRLTDWSNCHDGNLRFSRSRFAENLLEFHPTLLLLRLSSVYREKKFVCRMIKHYPTNRSNPIQSPIITTSLNFRMLEILHPHPRNNNPHPGHNASEYYQRGVIPGDGRILDDTGFIHDSRKRRLSDKQTLLLARPPNPFVHFTPLIPKR